MESSASVKSYASTAFEIVDEIIGLYMIVLNKLQEGIATIDKRLSDWRPSHIVVATLLTLFVLQATHSVFKWIYANARLSIIMRYARGLPLVRTVVGKKLDKIGAVLKKELSSSYGGEDYIDKLPKKKMRANALLKKIQHYETFNSTSFQQGRISGAIYVDTQNVDYNCLLKEVMGSTMWSNPLHADVFAGVRKMEAEIVRMVASMYNGDPAKVSGSVTSGGTESILMACKAYRDYAIKFIKRLGDVERPEFVVPETAHAAFEKAAHFLNCKIIMVPIDKKTLKVNLKAMEAAIGRNTCMLVGSAPNFPHGIVDPIAAIGKLGLKYRVPVHVDACLGGFLLPFMEAAGHSLDEAFDFRVAGVTSISADPHKYGFAPKGVSVVMYSDRKYIHEQYSIQTNWPGGVYASATLPGSRPGALIAACWTAMLFHGVEGYVSATDLIMKTTKKIKAELGNGNVKGLRVMGEPHASILAFTSDRFNILMLNDKLKNLGWNLNPLQFPPAFHLCLTLMHCNNNVAATFIRNVKDCVDELLNDSNHAPAEGSGAAMYGMCQTIPDRSIVSDVCKMHLDACLGH